MHRFFFYSQFFVCMCLISSLLFLIHIAPLFSMGSYELLFSNIEIFVVMFVFYFILSFCFRLNLCSYCYSGCCCRYLLCISDFIKLYPTEIRHCFQLSKNLIKGFKNKIRVQRNFIWSSLFCCCLKLIFDRHGKKQKQH